MLFQLVPIVLIAGIQLVAAANAKPEFAPPDVLTSGGDPDTILQPYVGREGAVDESKVIRGLLVTRQSGCPGGYGSCRDGGCCPLGGACCGGGCCNPGYYCTVVSGQTGCCRIGKICTSIGGGGGGCVTSGYVRCAGENFCCPPGYTCYRDSAGTPRCSLHTTYTITSTSTIPKPTPTPPTTTYTSPQPTSTPKSGGDDNSNSDDSNNSSSDNSNPGTSTISNGTSSSSTRSNSTPRSTLSLTSSLTPLPSVSGLTSNAMSWKGSLSCFGLAPFLVLIAYVL